MNTLKQLTDISETFKNIKIQIRDLHYVQPRWCGSCSYDDTPSIITKMLYLEITNPKNWEELDGLLEQNNFKFSEESNNNNEFIKVFDKICDKDYPNSFDCALHKNPGFDEAFKAMKILKPQLTEYEFAFTCGLDIDGRDEADSDLVTESLYNGESDCILDNNGSVVIIPDSDMSVFVVNTVSIRIPARDIGLNIEILTKIILTQQ